MDDLDLIYIISDNGKRTMMAATPEWHSSEVPANGAFGLLMPEITERYPDADRQQLPWLLQAIHATNLRRGMNAAGQSYPLRIADANADWPAAMT